MSINSVLPLFDELVPVILDPQLQREAKERGECVGNVPMSIRDVPACGEFKSYGLNETCVVQEGLVTTNIDDKDIKGIFGAQRKRILYGKEFLVPRLEAVMASSGALCSYSKNVRRFPWSGAIAELRKEVAIMFGTRFNMAILNYYRNGEDYVAAHSDNEPEIAQNYPIVTVSYGAPRIFRMREKKTKKTVLDILTGDGTVLAMHGTDFQTIFTHEITKQSVKRVSKPRLSITFRCVNVHGKENKFEL